MFNYKRYLWAFGVALSLTIAFSIIQNILAGEKGRVRKFILQAKQIVERQDLLACIGIISDDYKDKYSNDKQSLIYFTRETFRYYKQILVQIDKMDIELTDDKKQAIVSIDGLVLGVNKSDKQETILEKEQGKLKIKLTKEEGRWLLLEVESFESLTIMGQNIS
jgi:hypothetical protein